VSEEGHKNNGGRADLHEIVTAGLAGGSLKKQGEGPPEVAEQRQMKVKGFEYRGLRPKRLIASVGGLDGGHPTINVNGHQIGRNRLESAGEVKRIHPLRKPIERSGPDNAFVVLDRAMSGVSWEKASSAVV